MWYMDKVDLLLLEQLLPVSKDISQEVLVDLALRW